MRPWDNCCGLFRLFGIEPKTDRWAALAADLVEFDALLLHFTGLECMGDLERRYMHELHLSPLVFWSQLKRSLRPLHDAGGDTMRALGVDIEGDSYTTHSLLTAIAWAVRDDTGEDDEDAELARQLKEVLGL